MNAPTRPMDHNQLRALFLKFFKDNGHAVIASETLVPENYDPANYDIQNHTPDHSTMFTTAGVQPLIPYLKKEAKPFSLRLANAQKCVRTNDLSEVGDDTHLTFFEMLGSWSIGDYFKDDAIKFAHGFIMTEAGLNLPRERLWVTTFGGNKDLPNDDEAQSKWAALGVPADRIVPLHDNWWQTGDKEGLCGPCTEVFYDTKWPEEVPAGQNPGNDPDGRFLEIWNSVFMGYEKRDGVLSPLVDQAGNPAQNVDQGAGLERILSVVNGHSIYDTSCFESMIKLIKANSIFDDQLKYKRERRVIADHLRAVAFILSEDPLIKPDVTGRGYVLHRLIREVVSNAKAINMNCSVYGDALKMYADMYKDTYPELGENMDIKLKIVMAEKTKIERVYAEGPKVLDRATQKFAKIAGTPDAEKQKAEILYDVTSTYGIPLEFIAHYLAKKQIPFNKESYNVAAAEHRERSKIKAATRAAAKAEATAPVPPTPR